MPLTQLPELLLAPYLSYKSLGRLLQTCKTASTRLVAPHQIADCRRRAREALHAPPHRLEPRFGGLPLFELFDLDERGLELGLFHVSSDILVARHRGTVYLGNGINDVERYSQRVTTILRDHATARAIGAAAPDAFTLRVQSRSKFCPDGDEHLLLFIELNRRGAPDEDHWVSVLFMHPLKA